MCTFKQERHMQPDIDVVTPGCQRNHRSTVRKGHGMFIVHVPALVVTKLHLVPCTGGFLR